MCTNSRWDFLASSRFKGTWRVESRRNWQCLGSAPDRGFPKKEFCRSRHFDCSYPTGLLQYSQDR